MTEKKTRLGIVARQRCRCEGAEPDLSFDADELGELDGKSDEAGDCNSTSAKKNSFQAEMNAKSSVTTTPGASSGAMIRTTIWMRRAPVDGRRLLEVARDVADVALEHPEDERERPDEVDEDQPRVRVRQVQVAEHQEQRDDDQDQREHLADEDVGETEPRDPAALCAPARRPRAADERSSGSP